MNRVRSLLPACFLLVAFTSAAFAQDTPPVEDLLERLDRQEAELKALKERVAELEEDDAPPGEPGADPAPEAEDEASKIKLGFLYIESADKSIRFDVKGRVIAEYRASDHGHRDFDNSFEDRQVRLQVKGKLWERVTLHIALEFGRGTANALRQGWVNFKAFDWLQLKAGQDKLPLSFTFLEPFMYMNHAEWPIAVGNEVQNFELGAQLWGWLFDKKLKYVIAGFNGNGPNTRSDIEDDKDFVTRLEVHPFAGLNLHVAGAYTPTDRSSTGPSNARTLGGQHTTFLSFAVTNRRLKYRQRATAGAALRLGPFEVLAEFLMARHRRVVTVAGERANLTLWSYYVEAVYILTGEDKKKTIAGVDDPVWDPKTKDWGLGAFAIALRFEDFQVEKSALTRGFATGTDKARAVAATLSWWPFDVLRYSVTYSYTHFDDRVADSTGRFHKDDHIVVVRAWLVF